MLFLKCQINLHARICNRYLKNKTDTDAEENATEREHRQALRGGGNDSTGEEGDAAAPPVNKDHQRPKERVTEAAPSEATSAAKYIEETES